MRRRRLAGRTVRSAARLFGEARRGDAAAGASLVALIMMLVARRMLKGPAD